MSAFPEKLDDVSALNEPVSSILGPGDFSAYRFCDDVAGEHKVYDVYQIVRPDGAFILKHYDNPKRFETEKSVYERFSADLPVPRALGFADGWAAMSYLAGGDLREMTDDSVCAAAAAVAKLMNAFPPGQDYDRAVAESEIAYREKRLESLKSEPLLCAAYKLFLDRVREMPLTLANGDLLPLNCIYDGERVYIIDWEYGGFMPYALDLGRFLAHSGEDPVYPYRMTETQKRLFIDVIYDGLREKPDKAVFERDVKLAVFDETVMVLSFWYKDPNTARDETFRIYFARANTLAKELLD